MNWLWFPGLESILFGRMGLVVTVATLTFTGVVLAITRKVGKPSGCPFRGLSSLSFLRRFWLLSERLKSASRLGWLVIAKVVACLYALRSGRRHPQGRHRDL
eukprot:5100397-Amphidinium_carterae.1